MEEQRRSESAIRSIRLRYYVIWAFYTFGPLFVFAVYPLFLRSRGLDQLQINIVTACYVLITFLTDVPTGAFADAVGRRAAVVVGCALHATAFTIYFLSHRYWEFIIAASVDGLGTTFGNGPIDAWAIDALDAAGFEGAKDALFSRKFQIGQIVGVCGTLAGAYIAQVKIATPFLLNAIVWIGTGMVALLMMSSSTGQRRKLSNIAKEIQRRSIDSTRLGFADRKVRLLSIAGLLSASLWYGWDRSGSNTSITGFMRELAALDGSRWRSSPRRSQAWRSRRACPVHGSTARRSSRRQPLRQRLR